MPLFEHLWHKHNTSRTSCMGGRLCLGDCVREHNLWLDPQTNDQWHFLGSSMIKVVLSPNSQLWSSRLGWLWFLPPRRLVSLVHRRSHTPDCKESFLVRWWRVDHQHAWFWDRARVLGGIYEIMYFSSSFYKSIIDSSSIYKITNDRSIYKSINDSSSIYVKTMPKQNVHYQKWMPVIEASTVFRFAPDGCFHEVQ